MDKINQIRNQIQHIISRRESYFLFKRKCKAIFDFLSDIEQKISNIPNDAQNDSLDGIIAKLNDLDRQFDLLKPKDLTELKNVLDPIFKPIQDLDAITSTISSYLQNLGITPDKDYQIPKLDLAYDFIPIYNLLLNTNKLQEFRPIPGAIIQLLKEVGHPIDSLRSDDDDLFLNSNQINKLSIRDYQADLIPIEKNTSYKIYKGRKKSTQEPVTIMFLDKKTHSKENFNRLIEILEKVEHTNLEKFKGYDESEFAVITERKGETLIDLLLGRKPNEPLVGKKTKIAFEIASAMAFLHSQGIIHRNLNAANVLVDSSSNARIANFASSRFVPENVVLMSFPSNARLNECSSFKAPELYSNDSYDKPVDVFSFAAILYTMLTGEKPFAKLDEEDLKESIMMKKRPPLPDDAPKDLVDLIESCWSQAPRARPSFSEVVDKMLRLQIKFPDDNEQEVSEFYSSKAVRIDDLNECLELFKKIVEMIGQSDFYMYECDRVRTYLLGYHYLLETSSLATSDHNDSEKMRNMFALKGFLVFLKDNIEYTNSEKWIPTALSTSPTEISDRIYDNMDEIYKILKYRLGLPAMQFQLFKLDMVNDYNHIYDFYCSLLGSNLEKMIESRIDDERKARISEEMAKEILPNDSEYEKKRKTKAIKESVEKEMKEKRNYQGRQTIIAEIRQQVEAKLCEINDYFKMAGYDLVVSQEDQSKNFQIIFSQFKDYNVRRENYKIVREIKKGTTATVFVGEDLSTGKEVAIKEFKLDYISDFTCLFYLRREISFYINLHHKYLINFQGFNSDDGKPLWLISDKMRTSLFDAIKTQRSADKKLTPMEKTKIAFKIAVGMEYLHSKRVIHRDLKTSNILLDDKNRPIITDFGYSRVNLSVLMSRGIGTANYMAPEVFKDIQEYGMSDYGFGADVFSFGMVLYEMYSGRYPFEGKSKAFASEAIQRGVQLLYCFGPVTKCLVALIKKCTAYSPEERPSFKEVIKRMIQNEVFFSGADEDEVHAFYEKKMKKRKDLFPE